MHHGGEYFYESKKEPFPKKLALYSLFASPIPLEACVIITTLP